MKGIKKIKYYALSCPQLTKILFQVLIPIEEKNYFISGAFVAKNNDVHSLNACIMNSLLPR
jgi:hypothetical protein